MPDTDAKKRRRANEIVVRELSPGGAGLESRALEPDDFASFYGGGDILEPPYNPELLIRLPEQSDILGQCIDAYSTNIAGFGYELEYEGDYDKADDAEKAFLDKNWEALTAWLNYCNMEHTFSEIMERAVNDRERLGWFAIEVIEDTIGRPAGLVHIPAQQIRICRLDERPTVVKRQVRTDDGKIETIAVAKRFRRFAQLVNGKTVYFKEFGDPRKLNYQTGVYDEATPPDQCATAIICSTIYCAYTPYGLPRYMGQLLNMLGSRKAAELNYTYFRDGRHMPSALIVENGKLTKKSTQLIEESKGDLARHKLLILEAEGDMPDYGMDGDERKNVVRIRFEPLTQMLQNDGLFRDYTKDNRDSIRSSFRLHPIYTGESQDYTRATADTARRVTEEQVFHPEREKLAHVINNLLCPALGIFGVKIKFSEPELTDDGSIATALSPYVSAGAVTPNMLLDPLGRLLGKTFEPFPPEYGDVPIGAPKPSTSPTETGGEGLDADTEGSITSALEAAQNELNKADTEGDKDGPVLEALRDLGEIIKEAGNGE